MTNYSKTMREMKFSENILQLIQSPYTGQQSTVKRECGTTY